MSDIDDEDFAIRAPYVQKILELEAAITNLAKTEKRYLARRKSIYKGRMRLQIEGPRITEAEFNAEYDTECERLAGDAS